MTVVARLTGATKRYVSRRDETLALDGVSLSFGVETVALLGPNGAGKSTLMNVLAGSLDLTSGGAWVDPDARPGVVFQSPALDGLLTVRENLTLAGRLHAMDRSAIASRAGVLCEQLGIADRLGEQVRRLSGGLARRADIARALLPGPRLLLLDEPTSGLDVDARQGLLDELASVARRDGVAMVLSTHLFDEARIASRVVMLDHGRVVGDGEPGELVASMGRRVLRLTPGETTGMDALTAWCGQRSLEHAVREGVCIVRDASEDHVAGAAIGDNGVASAPPTLLDVYQWSTARGAGVVA